MSQKGLNVFISYSHKDADMCEKFRTQLSNLSHLLEFNEFYDGMIFPGEEIDEEIKKKLNNSDIVLLLISPNYIASHYCYETELESAIERHNKNECVVVPVILRDFVRGKYLFSGLKFVPTDGKPIDQFKPTNSGYVDAATGIYNLMQHLSQKQGDKKGYNNSKSILKSNKSKKQAANTQSNDIFYSIVRKGKISEYKATQNLFDNIVKVTYNLPQFYASLSMLVEEQTRNFARLIPSSSPEQMLVAQGKININSFLLQIFSYIQMNFIGIDNTCAHIRKKTENKYISFVNFGYPIKELSTEPIDADGGMIECSKMCNMPVIKSLNTNLHKKTHSNEAINRDYITFTLGDLSKSYGVDISMCISIIGKKLSSQKDILQVFSILRIDKIVEKFLMQYIFECTKLVPRYDVKKILN